MKKIDKAFVADAVIAVKKKVFQENYATVKECDQIAKKMQKRLKDAGIEAVITEEVNGTLLQVNHSSIEQRKLLENFDLSRELDEELRKVIYDEVFIVECLQSQQKIRIQMIERFFQ